MAQICDPKACQVGQRAKSSASRSEFVCSRTEFIRAAGGERRRGREGEWDNLGNAASLFVLSRLLVGRPTPVGGIKKRGRREAERTDGSISKKSAVDGKKTRFRAKGSAAAVDKTMMH